jgi:adenylylsulfate kinase-like enzyme
VAATDDLEGVLITGVYGTGKSSVAAEIAETLERLGVAYGAVDLDWVTWFDVPGMARDAANRVYLANVADVVRNYREFGVRRLVFAGAVHDRNEVRELEEAAAVPLRVVRLEVPFDEIERRLQEDPTTGRRDDLHVASEWLESSVGVGVEDLAVANEGRIQDVALHILRWLGWIA